MLTGAAVKHKSQMFKPIKKAKVYEEIVAKVKDMIEKGRFKSGDQLPFHRKLVSRLEPAFLYHVLDLGNDFLVYLRLLDRLEHLRFMLHCSSCKHGTGLVLHFAGPDRRRGPVLFDRLLEMLRRDREERIIELPPPGNALFQNQHNSLLAEGLEFGPGRSLVHAGEEFDVDLASERQR